MTEAALPGVAVSVRSVLGDTRVALVNPGDGFPWFNCPFCTYPVYVGEPSPACPSGVARDGTCSNGWCLANPAMPVDAARVARGEAILQDMAAEARQRDHNAARLRIESERQAAAEWREEQIAEATRRGACRACLFAGYGRVKFIKHRGRCPKAL